MHNNPALPLLLFNRSPYLSKWGKLLTLRNKMAKLGKKNLCRNKWCIRIHRCLAQKHRDNQNFTHLITKCFFPASRFLFSPRLQECLHHGLHGQPWLPTPIPGSKLISIKCLLCAYNVFKHIQIFCNRPKPQYTRSMIFNRQIDAIMQTKYSWWDTCWQLAHYEPLTDRNGE